MNTNATETKTEPIAPLQGTPITVPTIDDSEARIAALETEKAKLIEREANYKLAYLKEKKKNSVTPEEEDEEDKMRRIANETLANSRIMEIDREKDELIKKTLKENKELKLAQFNKANGIPTSIGNHTEGKIVQQDTLVTPEQLAAFKARGWTEKDIERYKKNLLKNSR